MDVEKDISCIFGVFTKIWYLRREIDSDDQYHTVKIIFISVQ